MCWPSDSSMLVVCMFSSPICRVRVVKPLDEAVRRGGLLELELVDRCPKACRAHSVERHSAMTNLQPDIVVVEAEVAAA